MITTRFHFDREHLGRIGGEHRDAYLTAQPFAHAVFDDFLPESVLDDVIAEFPTPDRGDWWRFDSPTERKLATNDISLWGEATRHLFSEFNSAAFLDFLQDLTGIKGLVPDPHFFGGGLHQIQRGGHLNIHADFNRHQTTGLERRLNVLVYLNRDWEEEFGGALELWKQDMSECGSRILPVFNRCVVFSTTDRSFHGHPDPLNCPPERSRRSLALYYYAKDAPPGAGGADHNTLFQNRPGEVARRERVSAPLPRPSRAREVALRVAPPILVDGARWARRRVREARNSR